MKLVCVCVFVQYARNANILFLSLLNFMIYQKSNKVRNSFDYFFNIRN